MAEEIRLRSKVDIKALKALRKELRDIERVGKELQKSLAKTGVSYKEKARAVRETTITLGRLKTSQEASQKAQRILIEVIDKHSRSLYAQLGVLGRVIREKERAAKAALAAAAASEEERKALEKLRIATERQEKAQEKIRAIYEVLGKETKNLTELIHENRVAVAKHEKTIRDRTKAEKDAKETEEEATKELRKKLAEMTRLEKAYRSTSKWTETQTKRFKEAIEEIAELRMKKKELKDETSVLAVEYKNLEDRMRKTLQRHDFLLFNQTFRLEIVNYFIDFPEFIQPVHLKAGEARFYGIKVPEKFNLIFFL